jgi:hypothetical protein
VVVAAAVAVVVFVSLVVECLELDLDCVSSDDVFVLSYFAPLRLTPSLEFPFRLRMCPRLNMLHSNIAAAVHISIIISSQYNVTDSLITLITLITSPLDTG